MKYIVYPSIYMTCAGHTFEGLGFVLVDSHRKHMAMDKGNQCQEDKEDLGVREVMHARGEEEKEERKGATTLGTASDKLFIFSLGT